MEPSPLNSFLDSLESFFTPSSTPPTPTRESRSTNPNSDNSRKPGDPVTQKKPRSKSSGPSSTSAIEEKNSDYIPMQYPKGGKKGKTRTNRTQGKSLEKKTSKTKLTDEDLRWSKFHRVLESDVIDMDSLREVSWNGIPSTIRSLVWKILLGYLPLAKERQNETLEKKRLQYWELKKQMFDTDESVKDVYENTMMRQISVDTPRIQMMLNRLLYIYAVTHPASGYVQGMTDLVIPFLSAFLRPYLGKEISEIEEITEDDLSIVNLEEIEADIYWCLTHFLSSIQDHYTYAQPGIQKMIFQLSGFIERLDKKTADHLKEEGVEYMQFAFRWINCIFTRELKLPLVLRVWDAFISDGDFVSLQLYVCAALLIKFTETIRSLTYTDLVVYLQSLPTSEFTKVDIDQLLSQAYVWKVQFHDTPKHLNSTMSSF